MGIKNQCRSETHSHSSSSTMPFVLQVLIKVHTCGINPVETYIRSGTYARKPALPYTPGSDVAGVIEGVGEHVTAFQVLDFKPIANSLPLKQYSSLAFALRIAL